MSRQIMIVVPTAKNGGAEKQALLLMKALMHDYQCYYVILYPGKEKEPDWDAWDFNKNCHIIRLSGGNTFSLYRQIKNICIQYSIDAIFSYLTKPDFLCALVGRNLGIKDIFLGIRNERLPFWKLLLEKIANRYSKKIVINNYSGKDKFEKLGLHDIEVITNCYVDFLEPFERQESDIVKIITVGRFVAQKDFETAIKAVADLSKTTPGVKYSIVGFGELESSVRSWKQKYDINDCIEIVINPKDVIQRLKNADIYLCTSLFEGTSNSIMEALDAALPVVATDVGDNNRLVIDGFNGYIVNTGDINAIVSKLETLVKDRSARLEMGFAGNKHLKKEYSFEKFKERYINLMTDN